MEVTRRWPHREVGTHRRPIERLRRAAGLEPVLGSLECKPSVDSPGGSPLAPRVHYERHRPEQTTLYRLMQQHAATFIVQAEAAAEPTCRSSSRTSSAPSSNAASWPTASCGCGRVLGKLRVVLDSLPLAAHTTRTSVHISAKEVNS